MLPALLLLLSWKTKFTLAVPHEFDVGELFPPLSAVRSSKQKHSPLCSRVRNNVRDEAAHNVPLPPRGECDPFLSIHNAGATQLRPPRLRGPGPSPNAFGASARPNGAKTKDCGRQQKRVAEGRGRIPAVCAAK